MHVLVAQTSPDGTLNLTNLPTVLLILAVRLRFRAPNATQVLDPPPPNISLLQPPPLSAEHFYPVVLSPTPVLSVLRSLGVRAGPQSTNFLLNESTFPGGCFFYNLSMGSFPFFPLLYLYRFLLSLGLSLRKGLLAFGEFGVFKPFSVFNLFTSV